MFQDRSSAGKALARKLVHYKNEDTVVIGIPRGGVPIAYEIATYLRKPLGIILVKKVGHPINKEYAIGAVSLDGFTKISNSDISESYIRDEVQDIRKRLLKMKELINGNDYTAMKIENKVVILVDDGIATGYTMLTAYRLLKKCKPKDIVVAIPVSTKEAIDDLKKEGAIIMVIEIPYFFNGIGAFYEDFSQIENEQVFEMLEKYNKGPFV
jgi:putative phosphoribosyl transferase